MRVGSWPTRSRSSRTSRKRAGVILGGGSPADPRRNGDNMRDRLGRSQVQIARATALTCRCTPCSLAAGRRGAFRSCCRGENSRCQAMRWPRPTRKSARHRPVGCWTSDFAEVSKASATACQRRRKNAQAALVAAVLAMPQQAPLSWKTSPRGRAAEVLQRARSGAERAEGTRVACATEQASSEQQATSCAAPGRARQPAVAWRSWSSSCKRRRPC